MNKKEKKKLLTMLGFVSLVLGIFGGIPSFLSQSYLGLSATGIFVILGVVLLAMGWE